LGCLQRIQDFLELDNFQDPRSILERSSSALDAEDASDDKSLAQKTASNELPDIVVSITNLALKTSTQSEDKPSSISFTMKRATVTMILGPVGSGKSTLLKAVLGEMKSQGEEISVSGSSIAYCSQTPWLQNLTIRENIIGPKGFENELYAEVLWLCALDKDIEHMPDKDTSAVGSGGLTLSGGQKHRIVSFQWKNLHCFWHSCPS
jgi:ATP-binding cassette, subfamily C (CFTR/MRP), member 1